MPDPSTGLLGVGAVFTLMFVMLGPLKVLGPFAAMTHGMDPAAVRRIAIRAFAIALVSSVAGGYVGMKLMQNWGISVPAMLLAGGIIFFLVGLNAVFEQYHTPPPPFAPLPAAPMAAALRVAFPTVVTPYGIAALIVLFANSQTHDRLETIVGVLAGVMLLNLLAMMYAQRIMEGFTLVVLKILGAVLGVLQIALAVEMVLRALRELGALRA